MAAKTTRVYYGVHPETNEPLYWTLKVKNATRSVVINGTVEEAMKGEAGKSIGCHLSKVAQKHKHLFPHKALFFAFTSSCLKVITKITRGTPSHCVRYSHSYGKYVNLNDKDPGKKVVKEHPSLFNRKFTVRPYKVSKAHWKKEYGRQETGERKMRMMTGDRKRMQDAGLIIQAI